MQITSLNQEMSSLERKCKNLEAKIEQDSQQYDKVAKNLKAALKQNLELESVRQALTNRSKVSESDQAALERQNAALTQQVLRCHQCTKSFGLSTCSVWL